MDVIDLENKLSVQLSDGITDEEIIQGLDVCTLYV